MQVRYQLRHSPAEPWLRTRKILPARGRCSAHGPEPPAAGPPRGSTAAQAAGQHPQPRRLASPPTARPTGTPPRDPEPTMRTTIVGLALLAVGAVLVAVDALPLADVAHLAARVGPVLA